MRAIFVGWRCLAVVVGLSGTCAGQAYAQLPPPQSRELAPAQPAARWSDAAETRRSVAPSDPAGLAELLAQQPCEFYDIKKFLESWYLACGRHGLWVLTPASQSSGLVALDGAHFRLTKRGYPGARVVGLTLGPAELNAQIQLFVALNKKERPGNDVLLAFDPQAAASTSAPDARVLAVQDLHVQVNIGAADGVHQGDRIEFDTPRRVVGRVMDVQSNSCSVRLGMGEELPTVGSAARRTHRSPTRLLAFPNNSLYLASILLGGRIGHIGQEDAVMGMGEFNAFVQLGRLRMGVQSGPVGGGGGVFIYQIAGQLGFHHTIVGVDALFGSMKVNSPVTAVPPGTALTFGPAVRFGPEDGIHITTRVLLAVSYQTLMFGEARASFQTPVYQSIWLLVRGSGGKLGMSSFDVGPKFMLAGNGGPGSSLLHVFGGPLVIYERDKSQGNSFAMSEHVGPALGFEWEMRL